MTNPGHHSGYAEAGTVLLQDGGRVAADTKTLEPLSPTAPQLQATPEPAPEKSKSISKPADKAADDQPTE